MTNPITEILPGVLVWQYPDDAEVTASGTYYTRENGHIEYKHVPGSLGPHTFLFTTHSMTEEQAGSLVGRKESFGRVKRYQDYQYVDSAFYTALESFHSALTAKNLDTDKNYAVIQKNK